jgi:hypothetical protein
MKKAITLTLGTGLFLFAGSALAQYGQPPPQQQGGQWGGSYGTSNMPAPTRSSSWSNIGDEGQLTISVDRIMGVAFNKFTLDQPTVGPTGNTTTTEVTNKSTTIALFGQSGGGGLGGTTNFPRLSLDYFPIEGLSLGGSLLYIHTTSETETDAGSADGPSSTTFGIAPRVGYAMAFDETFAFWPRAGITYFSNKSETTGATAATDSETTVSGVLLNVEALLEISPFENFALGIGPYIDVPLSGTIEQCTGGNCNETDGKLMGYGLMTSVQAYFSP